MDLVDWLFRLGLYRGVGVACPQHLLECKVIYDGIWRRRYEVSVNDAHNMSEWLKTGCDGPWRLRLKYPYSLRYPYVAFARTADAVIFRLLST